jgi:DNA polymerase-3 subunit gamma/tau
LAQGAQAIEAKPALTKALTPVKPAVPSAASSDAKPLDVRAKLAEFKPSPKPASPTIMPPVQMAVVEQVVIDKPVVNVEPVAIATPDISEQVSAKIQDVQDWASLLQQLELSGMAKQFALNCVLSDINERLLTLTVEEQHAKMFNERIKMQIETALQKHFDSKIALQIVIGKSEQETPAATDKRIAADKMQAAEQALINDKNVHFIQNQFNAIIDKNSIKPRQ